MNINAQIIDKEVVVIKKVLVVLFFFLFLPTIASTEVSKNYYYNFQIELPKSWVDPGEQIKKCGAFLLRKYNIVNSQKMTGIFYVTANQVSFKKDNSDSDFNFSNASEEFKKQFIEVTKIYIKNNFPEHKITSSKFVVIRNYTVLLTTAYCMDTEKNFALAKADLINNNILYKFELITNDSNDEHMQQFLQVLDSFNTIY